jgi:hypothetical protein
MEAYQTVAACSVLPFSPNERSLSLHLGVRSREIGFVHLVPHADNVLRRIIHSHNLLLELDVYFSIV